MRGRIDHWLFGWLGIGLIALLAGAGCGSETIESGADGDDSNVGTYALEDGKHTRDVHVYDNVKRLADRAADVVYAEQDALYFPTSVAEDLEQYEPGDIMATAYGQGLLRRVEQIDQRGDQIVVETESATLNDVFASGEIYVGALAEPGIEAPESFQYEPYDADLDTVRQPLEASWDDEIFSWDHDFASDLNQRIPAPYNDYLKVDQASIGADMGGEFYVNAGASAFPPSFDLDALRVGANGHANATLQVRIESSDSFSFDRSYHLVSTDPNDNPIYDLPEQKFDVAGLVQLRFNAESVLDLHASAGGTLAAVGRVELNGNLNGGIERKSDTWKAYSDAGFSPSGSGPDYEGKKSFDAQAKLTTTLDVDVSDTAEGSLVVQPATVTADFSQQVNGSTGECPWHFNVNVRGDVSGQLESIHALGFDIDIMDSPAKWTMYNKDFLTKEGQLELTDVCDPDYEPPSFGDDARTSGMSCKEESDCDAGNTCFRNTCVTEGPVRFSVAWFEDTDVDLQVTTPSGETIDWKDYSDGAVDGFVYDFPTCTGECLGPGPYVESIYSDGPAQSGTYTVEVVHNEKRSDSKFTIQMDHDGDTRDEGGKLPAEDDSVSFDFEVN